MNYQNEYEWLLKLEKAVPTKGYGTRLSMYLLSLEAWRRGLKVKFFIEDNPDNKMLIRYSLSDGLNEYNFESSRGEKLSDFAYEVCENKAKTKDILSKAGISVPEGKRFRINQANEILDYARSLNYPVVLKPLSANTGTGVFANITNPSELKFSLNYVRDTFGFDEILIEKRVEGTEYRVLVLTNKVIAAVKRIPANITGNGQNTIRELIELKNSLKNNNPNLYNRSIHIDQEVLNKLNKLGYNLDTVLEDGKQIFLRDKVALDGDPIDVTDDLSNEIQSFAIKAVKSVPGLDLCGLDIVVDEERQMFTVLELNTRPMLGLHVYPVKGKARDVMSPIIDYYFPETANKNNHSMLYFDFNAVIAPLKDRSVKEVVLSPPPMVEQFYAKEYVLSGCHTVGDYKKIVRIEALKNSLHGFIKELPNKKLEIVVGSDDVNKLNNFKKSCIVDYQDKVYEKFTETDWERPIKIGFNIINIPKSDVVIHDLKKKLTKANKEKDNLVSMKNKEIQTKIKEKNKLKKKIKRKDKTIVKKDRQIKALSKENAELHNKIVQLETKITSILQSKSWKITQPFRSIVRFIKK